MSYLPRHLEGERGARPGYISEYMRKLILIALEHEFVEGVSSAVLDYKGNGSYSEIHTVPFRPIRQSRVTRPFDKTNFGRLSRVTGRPVEYKM